MTRKINNKENSNFKQKEKKKRLKRLEQQLKSNILKRKIAQKNSG